MRILIIVALIAGIAQPTFAGNWSPPSELVRGLCQQIEKPTSRSLLFHRSALLFGFGSPTKQRVDINNDGILEDIKAGFQGTASMPYLSAKDLIQSWVIPSDFSNGFDDIERWFSAINILHVSGYSFIIQARDRYFRKPSLLYMIGPDNRARALCAFSSEERYVLAASDELLMAPQCHALLQAGMTESVAVEALSQTDQPAHDVDASCCRPTPTGALSADILNSGIPWRLVRLEYHSGAGSGCGVVYYDLAPDPDRPKHITDQVRGKILSAQEIHMEEFGFNPHCSGSSGTRSLIAFDGKTYVFHKPTYDWHVYIRRIYPDRDGLGDGISEVCRFVRHPEVRISQTWFDWLRP